MKKRTKHPSEGTRSHELSNGPAMVTLADQQTHPVSEALFSSEHKTLNRTLNVSKPESYVRVQASQFVHEKHIFMHRQEVIQSLSPQGTTKDIFRCANKKEGIYGKYNILLEKEEL
jgi:hypothetical protein